jgi:hypothetical protein
MLPPITVDEPYDLWRGWCAPPRHFDALKMIVRQRRRLRAAVFFGGMTGNST